MNIIELAKQAEFTDLEIKLSQDNFAKFADLVEAAARSNEREEWARIAEAWDEKNLLCNCGRFIALQIRERKTNDRL